MIKITSENTKGKIQNYLYSYKNIDMGYYDTFEGYKQWYKEYKEKYDSNISVLALDIETKKLYPINNKLTMFAVSWKYNEVYYSRAFDMNNIKHEDIIRIIKSLNSLKSKIVMHNAYFDVTTLAIMFGVKPKWNFDTYIIYHCALTHRAKDDNDNDFGQDNTGLSLKDLTRDFLEYGDYEEQLMDFKKNYCKEHKIKQKDFTYDLIPSEILAPYNCMDVICTLQLYEKGLLLIKKLESTGYNKLRYLMKVKHEVTDIYIDARIRGIFIDRQVMLDLDSHFKNVMIESKNNIYIQLGEYITNVEKELYIRAIEKEMMKDFEYIAENKPKVMKNGKEKWVSKKVNITDSRINKIREDCKINFNSSQHKSLLFCDVMGLEPLEKSKKTNMPKCDIKFLEYHIPKHPELQSFIDFGKCRTALNNFLGTTKDTDEDDELGKGDAKTLYELTSDEYPYVHSSYNLNGTVTSRCSCSSINIQQIPSRGVLKSLKKCFKARDNHYLIYSDYSSAEVVILGSIINSETIYKSLINKWDLHSMNAWSMKKKDILSIHPDWEDKFKACGDDPDKLRDFYADIKSEFEQTIRYQTKSLVFSLAYGTTAHGVSKNLGISKKEAQELIDRYLDANPEMKMYIEKQHNKAKKEGYTENPFGSRLILPDCPNMNNTTDRNIKIRGDKQLKKSLNVPIQSSNAWLLYLSIIEANRLIKERGYEGKIHFIFSVYDSFCYEVHESVPKEEAYDIIEKSFCCYLGKFALMIDMEVGKSWGDLKSVERSRPSKDKLKEYNMRLY